MRSRSRQGRRTLSAVAVAENRDPRINGPFDDTVIQRHGSSPADLEVLQVCHRGLDVVQTAAVPVVALRSRSDPTRKTKHLERTQGVSPIGHTIHSLGLCGIELVHSGDFAGSSPAPWSARIVPAGLRAGDDGGV